MNPITVGALVLLCTFGGAVAGIWLRPRLPERHVDAESGSAIRLGIGLIATMTALVLGLVTSSAKSSFDATNTAIRHTATEMLALDRALARYGPDTARIRESLHDALAARVDATWPQGAGRAQLGIPDVHRAETIVAQIQALAPQNEYQQWLRARALGLSEVVLEARWLTSGGASTSVLGPFLAALILWLGITFASFGLFAPRNVTVVAVLFLCAVAVASAVFLVLEMDGPFEGLVTVSPEPLKHALAEMNR